MLARRSHWSKPDPLFPKSIRRHPKPQLSVYGRAQAGDRRFAADRSALCHDIGHMPVAIGLSYDNRKLTPTHRGLAIEHNA